MFKFNQLRYKRNKRHLPLFIMPCFLTIRSCSSFHTRMHFKTGTAQNPGDVAISQICWEFAARVLNEDLQCMSQTWVGPPVPLDSNLRQSKAWDILKMIETAAVSQVPSRTSSWGLWFLRTRWKRTVPNKKPTNSNKKYFKKMVPTQKFGLMIGWEMWKGCGCNLLQKFKGWFDQQIEVCGKKRNIHMAKYGHVLRKSCLLPKWLLVSSINWPKNHRWKASNKSSAPHPHSRKLEACHMTSHGLGVESNGPNIPAAWCKITGGEHLRTRFKHR